VLASVILALAQSTVDAPFNVPMFENSQVALCVRDLEGNVVFERNSGQRMMPASNQKLLTTAYALQTLGAEWRPKTKIWKTSGRTYVESEGDPLMTYSRLQEAVAKLKLDHRAPVYVKESYAPYWPEGWELDDLPNKYAAPVSAFTVDRGSFELWAENGRPKLLPTSYSTKIRWQMGPQTPEIRYDPFRREVTIVGSLPKDRQRLDTLSLPRPDEAAASILGSYFIRTEKVPTTAPTGILEGNTIGEAVAACLPPSDNNIAEHLLLMAAQRSEPLKPNPYPQAREQMANFLKRIVGWNPQDVRPMDGSGMSRHNLVTARGITQLLVWANNQPFGRTYRSAMAKPGQPGTLRDRLQGVSFAGKTGSLDMVVALSGYLRANSGKELAVSVLLNTFDGSATDARNAADQFVKNVAGAY
jgi:D-alanyl-D-alanine carboxypeptidase/D-alanyl-D-alanine-endopeptidase (penicillin-binding protein 4)